jgi:SAM-dependent methyltransferase
MTTPAVEKSTSSPEKDLVSRYTDGAYLERTPGWHVADSEWKARKVFEILERNNRQPKTVCDVGCGAGEILTELQKAMNAETAFTGFDISPQAIKLCAPKANDRLKFHQADFLNQTSDHYDTLLLLDVFEHVPDYLGFLTALASRADWFVLHIPLDLSAEAMVHRVSPMIHMRERYGHLHYFTAETAIATLEDTGYEIVDTMVTWDLANADIDVYPDGVFRKMKHAFRHLAHIAECSAYRRFPKMMARLRRNYNLMVLARPAP